MKSSAGYWKEELFRVPDPEGLPNQLPFWIEVFCRMKYHVSCFYIILVSLNVVIRICDFCFIRRYKAHLRCLKTNAMNSTSYRLTMPQYHHIFTCRSKFHWTDPWLVFYPSKRLDNVLHPLHAFLLALQRRMPSAFLRLLVHHFFACWYTVSLILLVHFESVFKTSLYLEWSKCSITAV